MFFSSKPSFIVYLRRDGLTIYRTKSQPVQVDVPIDVVQNLEVLDEGRLTEIIIQCATAQNLKKQKGICLLDDWVVFQKITPKATDTKQALADFESKVPFNPESRAVLSVQVKDQVILLATNKTILGLIIKAFEKVGTHVDAATPAAVFGVKDSKLTHEQVQRILSDSKSAQSANFLTTY